MSKAKKDETPEEKLPETEISPDAPVPEVSRIEELETALKAEKDKHLRLAAEFDNYRKRSIKEREAIYDDVRSDTIKKAPAGLRQPFARLEAGVQ